LLVAVRATVACVGNQAGNVPAFHFVGGIDSRHPQNFPPPVVVQVTLPSQFRTHFVTVSALANAAARVIAMMMIDFMVLSCCLKYNKFV
jgi:hypothetical protein